MQARLQRLEADVETSPESVARARSFAAMFSTYYPQLARRVVAGLTLRDIQGYRASRAGLGRTVGTINRELRELRAAIRLVRSDFTLPKSVFPKEDDLHAESLSAAEAAALFAEGPPGRSGSRGQGWKPSQPLPWPLVSMVTLAALTGLRASEVTTLRRERVRLDLREVLVRVKGGELARVKLPARPLAIVLEALGRQDTPFVFPQSRDAAPLHAPVAEPGGRGHWSSRSYQIGSKQNGDA